MAMMTSDQIDHLHVLRDVAIPNSSELRAHSNCLHQLFKQIEQRD